MPVPWGPSDSGGSPQKATPKADSGSFLSHFVGNLANIVRSIPQMPGQLIRDFTGFGHGDLPISGKKSISEILSESNKPKRQSISELLQAPTIRLIPGAYTASRALKGKEGLHELYENPGYTLLDVLPFLSKAGHVATKGTALAEEASRTAELAGKPAKALRIGEEGLKLHETAAAIGRKTPPGKWTAGMLRRHGLGGPEIRGTAIRVSQGENAFRQGVARELAPILGRDATRMESLAGREDVPSFAARFGVSTERMRQLTQLADQGVPGWRETLAPNEVGFLKATEDFVNKLSDIGGPLDKTKLFEFRGEVFGPEASRLRTAVKDFSRVTQKITRIKDRAFRPREFSEVYEGAGAPSLEELRQAIPDNSPYLYHFTGTENLGKIENEGLHPHIPGTSAYGPEGVYFASKAEDLFNFIPARKGRIGMLFRVARSKIPGVVGRGAIRGGEFWVNDVVPPQVLEFLGSDGKWHSLDRTIPNTLLNQERVAALRVNRAFERRPPARFQTALQPHYQAALEAEARSALPAGVELNTALSMIEEGFRRDIPGISNQKVANIVRGVNRTWQQLKAEGHDPQFIPHVSPEQASKLGFPKLVTERVPTLSIEKARTSRPAPWIPDIEVALSTTAYERLGQIHSEQLVNTLDNAGILRSEDSVIQEARTAAERKGTPTSLMQQEVQDYIRKNYESWSPQGLFPFGKYQVAGRAPSFLVPKGVGKVIEGFKPPSETMLTKLGRASNELLRTSVLDLNPAYYVGNAITAMTRQLIRGNPADLRFFPKALGMVLRDELPSELTRGGRMQALESAESARYLAGGRTLGRLATEAEGSIGVTRTGIRRVFTARDMMRRLASTIDDAGRAVGYIAESRRALRKGFTPEEAVQLGIEHAQKVLNGLDDMIPLERAIVRNIFPFYGWNKFMIQTILSYPFDHPWRAAFVSALAREVEDDWVDGLPERFRSYFFFGDPTKLPPGKVLGISAGFAVPETAVANLFTLSGFLSRMAPQYRAMQLFAGGSKYGGPDLYPNLKYDPVTGRETWAPPPFFQTLGEAYGSLTEPLFGGEDLEALRVKDPETYKRRILNSFGIRLPYEVNIPEEIQKSSKAQQRVEREQKQQSKVSAPTGGGVPW